LEKETEMGMTMTDDRPDSPWGEPRKRHVTVTCPHCKGRGTVEADTFGQRLKAIRTERGLTAVQLAEMCGGKMVLSANTITGIESGNNTTVDKARILARALRVSLGWLVEGEGQP